MIPTIAKRNRSELETMGRLPKNEERSVSQMDSVGIKLMNWRYQQTTPDLSIKLKQNMDCAGSHKNDTASKQRNVHACQEENPKEMKILISQRNTADTMLRARMWIEYNGERELLSV